MLRVLGIRAAMPPFSFALISRLSGSTARGAIIGVQVSPKTRPR